MYTVVTVPPAPREAPGDFLTNADVYYKNGFCLGFSARRFPHRRVLTPAYFPGPRTEVFDQRAEFTEICMKYSAETAATARVAGVPLREKSVHMESDGMETAGIAALRPPPREPIISSERSPPEERCVVFSLGGKCGHHGTVVRMPMEVDNYGNIFLRGVLPGQRDLYLVRSLDMMTLAQQLAAAHVRDLHRVPFAPTECSHVSEFVLPSEPGSAPGSEPGSEPGSAPGSAATDAPRWHQAKKCKNMAYNLVATGDGPCELLTQPALTCACRADDHWCNSCRNCDRECWRAHASPAAARFCEVLLAHFDGALRPIEESV
jgi:hypothetical protein